MAGDLVVREEGSAVVGQSDDGVASLPAAMEQIAKALNGARPDDLLVEYTSEGVGDNRRSSFRFRAIRK